MAGFIVAYSAMNIAVNSADSVYFNMIKQVNSRFDDQIYLCSYQLHQLALSAVFALMVHMMSRPEYECESILMVFRVSQMM